MNIILQKRGYSSWEELFTNGKITDIAIICTLDQEHYEPTMKALELEYHVLIEKPMSADHEECIEMEQVSVKYNRYLVIGHVLRYTDFWSKIQQVISEGTTGTVASVQLNENVEIMHMDQFLWIPHALSRKE